jgi:hypothetical protein
VAFSGAVWISNLQHGSNIDSLDTSHMCEDMLGVDLLFRGRARYLTTFIVFSIIWSLYFNHLLASPSRLWFTGLGSVSHPTKRPPKETLGSLSLTDDQCAEAFPGLNREIENAVAQGPFELKKGPDDIIFSGSVKGRIKDGKVRLRNHLFNAAWIKNTPFTKDTDL